MIKTLFFLSLLMLAFGLSGFGVNCNFVTAPLVVSTSPEDAEDELKLATVIVVRFSEPMDRASVESAFSIPGVTGSFSWNEDGDEVTFTPATILEEDESYQVTIWDTAQDLARTPLETPCQFGFRTVNLWTRQEGAGYGYSHGTDVTIDEEGNVYATGYHTGDLWIRKYNKDGDTLWTRTYDGPDRGNDSGEAIAVDRNGNVYVTGWEEVVGDTNDIWVGKSDPDGNDQWIRTHNGTKDQYDMGHGITVDARGDIYVIGNEDSLDGNWNVWIRKYDPDGTEQWTKTCDSPDHGSDEGYDIAVDASGHIYVIGSQHVPGEWTNIWIRKYDASRTEQWTRSYGSALAMTSEVYDVGKGIAVDAGGNVHVCGQVKVDPFYDAKWIRKYDAEGAVLWTDIHPGHYLHDRAEDIAVDAEGNVYVTGTDSPGEREYDIWVRKYDADGNILWTGNYSGPPRSEDHGYGIAADENGNIFVIGGHDSSGGGSSIIWIRKFDTDGNWAE